MNDSLFFKVFNNIYLRDYILKSICNNRVCYKRPFSEIKSLKWFIINNEYNLLVDKLISSQPIVIDCESLELLITSCKDFNIFKLVFEKKKEYLESISKDLLEQSIRLGSLFAFESFLKLYDQQSKTNDEEVNHGIELLNKEYFKYLIIYSIEMESYDIVDLLLNKYQDLFKFAQNGMKRVDGWEEIFKNVFSKKSINQYLNVVEKLGFPIKIAVKEILEQNSTQKSAHLPSLYDINKTNTLFAFLNDPALPPIDRLDLLKLQSKCFFIKQYGMEELKCKVYLLLYCDNYEKTRKSFNQAVVDFENSNLTMEEILIKYEYILIPYCIDYYFHNQQFEKLKGLVRNNDSFMQLVLLSNINFSMEGIRLCSFFKQFVFDFHKISDSSFFEYVSKVDSEAQIINFCGLIRQFENKKDLILTRYHSSYEKEIYIMLDYYTYNHVYENSNVNSISRSDDIEDLLFSYQQTSIESYNNKILSEVLLNHSDTKSKVINIKLLASIIARINNLDSNSNQTLLNDLKELNKVGSDYKEQSINILIYLFKNQLFKNIMYTYQIKWIVALAKYFKVDDGVLSNITYLCMNQIQIPSNEELKFKQEIKAQLGYLCESNLYCTFKVILDRLYPIQQQDKILEYKMFKMLKMDYYKSLSYIQKFKIGYINEETIKELEDSSKIGNIYNRKGVYAQFLLNANNNQVYLFFKQLNKVFINKDLLIKDLLSNDRFEIAIQLYGDQKEALNTILDYSVKFFRFDIIEYFLNNTSLLNTQDIYTLNQLFNKSKMNDQLVLFKLLLNHHQSFSVDHKLISNLISLGAYHCYNYISLDFKKYNIKFTLKKSHIQDNNLLKQYKRKYYLFNKLLIKPNISILNKIKQINK